MNRMLYSLSHSTVRWLLLLALLLLMIGWGWGLIFAPPDARQGDGFRIIYLHVPAAMWSMGIYICMAIAAFITVVWQAKPAEQLMIAMAPIGMGFTLITLVTGSIWGSVMWGTWWEWDARMTSELILLFLYLGMMALHSAFDQRKQAGKAAAILVLVGVVNLPIIHYSVEWWNTLHQPSTRSFQTIAPEMRSALRFAIAGYFCLFLSLSLMRLRNLLLHQALLDGQVSHLLTKETS